MTSRLWRDPLSICLAAFFRSVGIGYLAVVFAISLSWAGFSVVQIGVLVSLGLLGGAVGTLGVTFLSDRFGPRRFLVLLSLLFVMGGVALMARPDFGLMAFLAFIGMINGMGRDRGAAATLESAMLPQDGSSAAQAQTYVWYWVVVDVGLALGSLLGGLPGLFFSMTESLHVVTFGVYTAVMALSGLFYFGLSSRWDVKRARQDSAISPTSRRHLFRLSSLAAIDSFAGGFLSSTLVAYWLYARFGVEATGIGLLFFAARGANVLSYFVAGALARRMGLLYTMVFTHLPSHFLLFGMAFAPTFPIAAAFFLFRECLVEMDVPTRQAYLAAIVAPHERTFATGIVNLTRTAAWSVAPVISGYAMASLSLLAPLIAGGGIKIAYDLLFLFLFRRVNLSATEIKH